MNKAKQRQIAYAARDAQIDKTAASAQICQTLLGHAGYQTAHTVMWYLHCRSEVRTLPHIAAQLSTDKRIVVPYCTVNAAGDKQLGLWRLEALDELQAGMWNILEPPRERWLEPAKQVQADELDVVIVPGVAFDQQGGRLGNGAGYYDRLLQNARPDTLLIGVCYQAQLVPQVEMQAHDVFMDLIVTERAIYQCGGRRGR